MKSSLLPVSVVSAALVIGIASGGASYRGLSGTTSAYAQDDSNAEYEADQARQRDEDAEQQERYQQEQEQQQQENAREQNDYQREQEEQRHQEEMDRINGEREEQQN